ncbi:MAG: glutamate 5-kinase [Oscillospiraceae bacterium]|nr:glutamate 5-kinase [Oscillospiraceae bacterium]MCI7498783.1 glutamate 5-kinase [Oscillospiraceae bacterium]MDD7280105.1 glutamate 5-kinase [Oscillospiraceae bacterium]MDY2864780.1 glutamate 5-kinase [Oscillospiraceae bacterium]
MFDISTKKRIVIKVGTSTLTHQTGRLNIRRMERLVKTLADIQNSGREIILVSSGAIGLGMSKMGLRERPKDTPMKQACAAVGQCELMYMYDKLFGEYNLNVAQILLTRYILETPRKNNVENTFYKLIEHNIIPVVNENDTVAIDELELAVGENDSLAAHVGMFCHADLLIIMSDIDGFFDGDPRSNPDAKLIPVVDKIDDRIRALAGDAVSGLGSGGMITKINAAEIAMDAGFDMAIINGRNPDILYDLFDGKQVGTVFLANK